MIAYVFSLNSFTPGVAHALPPYVEVPDELLFNSNGERENTEREAA